MPPPPSMTSTPHRFLAGQGRRRVPSPEKDAKPASALRGKLERSREHSTPRTPDLPNSTQFAPTPRFSFGKPKAATQRQRSPSPEKPAAVQAFRASTYAGEIVEDAAGLDDGEDEMLDDVPSAIPTTERTAQGLDLTPHWTKDLASSPKRRRVGESDADVSPRMAAFKLPQTPASALANKPPSHVHHEDQSIQSSFSIDSMGFSRPSFLRQSAEPQLTSEPRPETFSPQKRGQKYLSGGMAETVQQWVIETGQVAAQARKGQGYLRGDDYVLRVKVDEISGDEQYTVHGKDSSGAVVKLMLTSHGIPDTDETEEVRVGSCVGIRRPTWELTLDDGVWTIVADWKLLCE